MYYSCNCNAAHFLAGASPPARRRHASWPARKHVGRMRGGGRVEMQMDTPRRVGMQVDRSTGRMEGAGWVGGWVGRYGAPVGGGLVGGAGAGRSRAVPPEGTSLPAEEVTRAWHRLSMHA